MADQLKCGRKVFDLVKGDRVMDNGACYQLITREVGAGWRNKVSPRVLKSEFDRYLCMNVESLHHNYGEWVTIWEYQGEKV